MEKIWGLAERCAKTLGMELVDIELGARGNRPLIRVFVDKPDGTALIDCTRVSREIEQHLDADADFTERYVLEVSSPGIERPLRKPADFERFSGHRVKIRFRGPFEGCQKVTGRIQGVTGTQLTIAKEDGEEWTFSLDIIKKANLVVDWDKEFQSMNAPEVSAFKTGGEGEARP